MAHPSDPRVMCRDHGRMYDSARETGCEVCRGEVAPAAEPVRAWGKLLAGMVAILVIATFFLGVDRDGLEASSHQILQMPASPYREEIEKLEYILYAESSYGRTDAEQIVFLSRKLAAEMREWESRLHMLPHIGEVRDFAEQVELGAKQGFADADLFATREAWQRLRDKIFEPADWFLRPG